MTNPFSIAFRSLLAIDWGGFVLHQSPVLFFDQQKGEEDLSPVLDTSVDSPDLKAVLAIVNFDLFVTVAALQQVSRGMLATCGLLVDSDLSILEP
jgi:hypothetical protein